MEAILYKQTQELSKNLIYKWNKGNITLILPANIMIELGIYKIKFLILID